MVADCLGSNSPVIEILSNLLGVILGFLLALWLEKKKKPALLMEIIPSEHNRVSNATWLWIRVVNKPLGKWMSWFTGRETAYACKARLRIFTMDLHTCYQMTGRWGRTITPSYEEVQLDPQSGGKIPPVPDSDSIILTHEDGTRTRRRLVNEQHTLDIPTGTSTLLDTVYRRQEDEDCFGWNNRDYLKDDYREPIPGRKLSPGQYILQVEIQSGGQKFIDYFIINNDKNYNEFSLLEISPAQKKKINSAILKKEKKISQKTDYSWILYPLDETFQISQELLEQLSKTFADGFGIKEGWDFEEIRKAIKRSTLLGLLKNPKGDIGGYAFYSIPEKLLKGESVIWEDAICIKKKLQQFNYSNSILRLILRRYHDRRFGWIGGRTQNTLVLLRYGRFGLLYPFVQTYDTPEGQELLRFLVENIQEVKEERENLDWSKGICKGVYKIGKLGNYEMGVQGVEKNDDLLRQWGFIRERGDAVIAVAKIDALFLENFLFTGVRSDDI